MKEWLVLNILLLVMITQTLANDQEVRGGIVNGQAVGRCVAGFCLPAKYSSLDPPRIVDENNKTLPNNVNVTTDIMDILMVSIFKCFYHSIVLYIIYSSSLYIPHEDSYVMQKISDFR